MVRLITILVVVLHQSLAYADELGMIVNGRAFHTAQSENGTPYNEENWGGGIQYDFGALPNRWRPFLTASGFKDSYNNNSYYVGGGYLHRVKALSSTNTVTTSVGGVGFLMSRVFQNRNRVFPGVLPVLSVKTEVLSINMTYVPKNYVTKVPIYFIQVVLPLDKNS